MKAPEETTRTMGTRRVGRVRRETNETTVRVELDLDGRGESSVRTGVPFLDHLLENLTKHARFDLVLQVEGDLDVDDHHTVEDAALGLGEALDRALGERRGLRRFGAAHAPLDEALARVVLDLSGRPFAAVSLGLVRERIGGLSTENATHFLRSLATASRSTLHVDVLRGENDHHRCEATFKALALALRAAVRVDEDGDADEVPSTKGVLR